MSIHVHLERFEGPLGLLLHLIREQEMDIFNINIHQITRQYLEYIKAMRRLDLEVAGEFIAMAATLLHIKSRMLLPQYTEEGEQIVEDPRKELVQKLIEYQKIKELSVDLYRQPLLGRDVLARGYRTDVEALEEGELVLEEKPLFSLIAAYRTALKNMKKTIHRVIGEVQSISARILEIKDLFVVGKRLVFNDLITDTKPGSGQVLVTFLSLLELAKMGFISLFQSGPFAELYIDPRKPIDRDVITQVESYDAVNAEQKAEDIFNKATQLSLDESVVESEDLPDLDRPVVEETFADAATDEEIMAEEERLFGEGDAAPGGEIAASNEVVVEAEVVVSDEVAVGAEVVASDEVVVGAEIAASDEAAVGVEIAASDEVAADSPTVPGHSHSAESAPVPPAADPVIPSLDPVRSPESLAQAARSALAAFDDDPAPEPKAPPVAPDFAFLTTPDKPEPEPGAEA